MEIVIGLGALVPAARPSWFTQEEYEALPRVSVEDDHEGPLGAAVASAIGSAGVSVVESEGAPWWWLATVRRAESGSVCVVPLPAEGPVYGLNTDGRLLLDGPTAPSISVAEFVRAIKEGEYGSTDIEVMVVPPPEVGAGDITWQVIEWIAEHAPEVILALGVERAADAMKDRRVIQLAHDWAAQRIESPRQLRIWVERKPEWYPERMAERLRFSTEAAKELLLALGYVDVGRGLMQQRSTRTAINRREAWGFAETPQYDDLDDLFDDEVEDEESPDDGGNQVPPA